jgi:hypothetical protein
MGETRIAGISTLGIYGNGAEVWANNLYNYGKLFIGGTGDTVSYTSDDYIYTDNARKLENDVWGGMKGKGGVMAGGISAKYFSIGIPSVTNAANYGKIEIYSSAVRGIGGLGGSIYENYAGTAFLANLANYGEILVNSPYRPWNTAVISGFGRAGTILMDRARIAGIFGTTVGRTNTNAFFIVNVLNYGYLHIENHPIGDISSETNLNYATIYASKEDRTTAESVWSTDVVDLIGGLTDTGNSYLQNNSYLYGGISSYMLNIGSAPSLVYKG